MLDRLRNSETLTRLACTAISDDNNGIHLILLSLTLSLTHPLYIRALAYDMGLFAALSTHPSMFS